MAKYEAWKEQEKFDSDMVKSDRPTTFVKYDKTGEPFITLAGWSKLANERGVIIDSLVVTETGLYFQGIASGYLGTDNEKPLIRWGGHTEPKTDLYTGEVDSFAYAKCISKTQRNLFKMIFYGDDAIEQILEDFTANNVFEPPPEPEPQKKRTRTAQRTQQPAQPPAEPAEAEISDARKAAQETYKVCREALWNMNQHEDKDVDNVYKKCLIYLYHVSPDALTDDMFNEMVAELAKPGLGDIGNFFKEPPDDLDDVIAAMQTQE